MATYTFPDEYLVNPTAARQAASMLVHMMEHNTDGVRAVFDDIDPNTASHVMSMLLTLAVSAIHGMEAAALKAGFDMDTDAIPAHLRQLANAAALKECSD